MKLGKKISFSMIENIPETFSYNLKNGQRHSYPSWYFINDSLMIVGNIVGMIIAFLFIFTTYRLGRLYCSISNLIACYTCLSIGMTSATMLFNAGYALRSDFRGEALIDGWCSIRGILLSLFNFNMYIALCLKSYNRFRCIVFHKHALLNSYYRFGALILGLWLIASFMVVPILLTGGVDYDRGSHLCLVSLVKIHQFIFTRKSQQSFVKYASSDICINV